MKVHTPEIEVFLNFMFATQADITIEAVMDLYKNNHTEEYIREAFFKAKLRN